MRVGAFEVLAALAPGGAPLPEVQHEGKTYVVAQPGQVYELRLTYLGRDLPRARAGYSVNTPWQFSPFGRLPTVPRCLCKNYMWAGSALCRRRRVRNMAATASSTLGPAAAEATTLRQLANIGMTAAAPGWPGG